MLCKYISGGRKNKFLPSGSLCFRGGERNDLNVYVTMIHQVVWRKSSTRRIESTGVLFLIEEDVLFPTAMWQVPTVLSHGSFRSEVWAQPRWFPCSVSQAVIQTLIWSSASSSRLIWVMLEFSSLPYGLRCSAPSDHPLPTESSLRDLAFFQGQQETVSWAAAGLSVPVKGLSQAY